MITILIIFLTILIVIAIVLIFIAYKANQFKNKIEDAVVDSTKKIIDDSSQLFIDSIKNKINKR